MTDETFSAADTENPPSPTLLGPAQIRAIAAELGVSPTKTLGQNFVHDPGTVRRIVREARISPGSAVTEVGPGLGSLTLAILEAGAFCSAVEIDPVLAGRLRATVKEYMPGAEENFAVKNCDAMTVKNAADLAEPPGWGKLHAPHSFSPAYLVANLPYNVAVPILLTFLSRLPSLVGGTVMVQAEVADRLAAHRGSKAYGIPSVKAAWYADVRRGMKISRNVFWPVPNVDSALVHFTCHAPCADVPRERVFSIVDAAFAQRRKTLRAALSPWAGNARRAELILRQAGIDPALRGEKLSVEDFAQIARVSLDPRFETQSAAG